MIDYATLEVAEKTLGSGECCNGTCHDCPNPENTLDSLMLTKAYEQEISALDDAYDADVDYLLSII